MALDWLCRPILLVFTIIFMVQSTIISSISDPEALIKLKNSFTNANALSSWVDESSPCEGDVSWDGILCSNGRVIGLRLENMGLSGKIDVDALVNISELRSVSFAWNSFSGAVPELSRLGYLKSIYLTGNQFSGEIPSDFFLNMGSLKKIWLSDNKFSGEIPRSLINSTNLLELGLENNEISGTIPSIDTSTLTKFNVSNNKLEGEIPAGFEKFNASSFQGNSDLCGELIGKSCSTTPPVPALASGPQVSVTQRSSSNVGPDSLKSKLTTTGTGIIVLSVMLLSVAGVLLLKLKRKDEDFDVGGTDSLSRDRGADHHGLDCESVEVQVSMPIKPKEIQATKRSGSNTAQNKGGGAELVMMNTEKGEIVLQDLMKASAEVLGNGGLGSSYKALLMDGDAVVVKRLREMNALDKEGFTAEIKNLGLLRHPNILPPLAFHYRKDEKLFIYDYMPKGSLLYLLHGKKEPPNSKLNWTARLKIIAGIARGLGFLHTELASSELPHGNLKSSNIFINHENEPVISEFGLNEVTNPSARRKVLLAYRAPEAEEFGVSPKSDVYCLGLVILEILTGKFPSQYQNNGKEGIDIVQWVESSIAEGRESELIDPEIANSVKSVEEMRALIHIGALCVEESPAQRLDLREAILRIDGIKEGHGGCGSSHRGPRSRSLTDTSHLSFASPGSTFLNDCF